MALYKDYNILLDTKRTPRIALQNIVAGETGNRLIITLTNGGSAVTLAAATHRVCLRVDSALGTRRQDSSVDDSGISFSNGQAIIILSKDSYTSGLNRCTLEVYTTETDANDTLICAAEFQFTAKANPTGENAGSVYPSLIKLENELDQLKTDTTAAKDAANSAASSANDAATLANTKAGLADTAATNADTKAGLADAAATSANSAASSATSAASSANSAASSANSAAAAANAAAAAAASRVGVRYITPTSLTWNAARTVATGTLGVTRSEIDALLDAGTLVAIYEGLDDGHEVMYPVSSDDVLYYSSLPSGWSNVSYYYTAEITGNDITIFYSKILSVPDGGTAGQVLTCTEHGYAWADLPTYNGGVS